MAVGKIGMKGCALWAAVWVATAAIGCGGQRQEARMPAAAARPEEREPAAEAPLDAGAGVDADVEESPPAPPRAKQSPRAAAKAAPAEKSPLLEKLPTRARTAPPLRWPADPKSAEEAEPPPRAELPDQTPVADPDGLDDKILYSKSEPQENHHCVRVFYATDRLPERDTMEIGVLGLYLPTAVAGIVTGLLAVCAFQLPWRNLLGLLTGGSLAVTFVLWYSAHLQAQKMERLAREGNRIYGNERHERDQEAVLEVGICEVSVPPDHRVGRVESPSILALEFSEDPQKHVVLQGITCLEEDVFLARLSESIRESPSQQAFVFIHGYNVSFDDAVKRTAQIAYDLQFDGAPICYSWPSQGGLAEYTRDEANVGWTVVHLEEFLTRVVERSGARHVHLIAHSMGNRALVQALERMALRRKTPEPMFGQVIMAAPDVDAAEFRDRYAPAVVGMARQATLYASSNDRALLASTTVHGYTRAGLSGKNLLVVSGVDTVDVSPIDTSLIGHSYYGNNPLMIRDMRVLVELGTPASGRQWLERALHPPGLLHWAFRRDAEESGGVR